MIIFIIYLLYSPTPPYGRRENLNNLCISLNLFVKTHPAEIYNFIIKNKSWPLVQRFKKHRSLDHYKNSSSSDNRDFLKFRKRWIGKSGIYKITFLPYRLFTYIGSSKDLGARFKYHYYMTSKLDTFLGYFIKLLVEISFQLQ